jgi:hypothetical protein
MYVLCFARICNHSEKVKVPVQDAQAGRVNPSPTPLCSVGGAVGGGGEVGELCSAWGF